MDRQEIIGELTKVIGDYLQGRGLGLVDLIYRYEGRDLFLKILVDRSEGGITLGVCSRLNKELSIILDETNIIATGYILEVSSPGIGRPLKNKSDFLRCIDKDVRFYLSEAINGKLELEGLVSRADEDRVYVDIEAEIIAIPLNKINKAKQII